uniref:Uncharacterized protein n=1 Tax=Trypanosoma vivax (strain Y486) TaxID=1055687 RepID=G0TUD2_TRYVY|nr:hypothetical protein TVY486_0402320 [Trypanosoma vivax Y486]
MIIVDMVAALGITWQRCILCLILSLPPTFLSNLFAIIYRYYSLPVSVCVPACPIAFNEKHQHPCVCFAIVIVIVIIVVVGGDDVFGREDLTSRFPMDVHTFKRSIAVKWDRSYVAVSHMYRARRVHPT